MDSRAGGWVNPRSGLGGHQDKQVGNTWLPPFQQDRQTLDSMYEFDAMSARIIDREPDDATREGINLTIPEPLIPAVEKEFERIEALTHVADGRRWGRLFGGGAVVLQVEDGQDPVNPINLATYRKLRGVYSLDRYDVVPAAYDTRAGSSTFAQPLIYWVSDSALGVQNIPVHRDRVIRFDGIRLPPRLRLQRDGWGGSVMDRVYTAVANWASGHLYAAQIISEFTQGVYGLKGMADLLDSDDGEEIAQRLEVIRMFQSVIGHIALDADGETFDRQTTNVAGLSDVLQSFTDYLVANTDQPKTVLLGEQPSGLNASADSEIRSWYDHVGAQQRKIYTNPVDRILRLMMAAPLGPTGGFVPEGKLFEWPPLWQPTDEEKANARKTNSEARKADVEAQIVSPDEARTDPELEETYDLAEIDPDLEGTEPAAQVSDPAAPQQVETQDAPPEGEPLLDAKTIGIRLSASSASIIRMHKNGQIRGWVINGRWRFAYSDVLKASARLVG